MRTRVGVLFGGQSAEHEISLMTATNILEAIDRDKYDVVKIGITKQGKWYIYTGPDAAVESGQWQKSDAYLLPADLMLSPMGIDVVFPALHGPMGEDGTVQGYFELLDIPVVGSGVFASAAAMDKSMANILFEHAGIPQAGYMLVTADAYEAGRAAVADGVERRFAYPVFVKPARMGSSIGVSRAKDREELNTALQKALRYDSKALVEEYIDGRELECAVLDTPELTVSDVGEVLQADEFYSYTAKYFDGGKSSLRIPAQLPEDVRARVRELAAAAFAALDCEGLARVDFFYRESTGELLLSEVNTLPGFTNTSMYPKLMMHAGLSYPELISTLIDIALRSHDRRRAYRQATRE